MSELPDPGPPTAQVPEVGAIVSHGIVLSEAAHWTENGVHILRSTEFNCLVEDESFERAVAIFVETAEDLAFFLGDLVREGKASESEREAWDILGPRVMEIRRRCEEVVARKSILASVLRRRRRGTPGGGWSPKSTPSSSSQPSLV